MKLGVIANTLSHQPQGPRQLKAQSNAATSRIHDPHHHHCPSRGQKPFSAQLPGSAGRPQAEHKDPHPPSSSSPRSSGDF